MLSLKKIDRMIDDLQEGPETWANLMQLEKLYNLREKMEQKEKGGRSGSMSRGREWDDNGDMVHTGRQPDGSVFRGRGGQDEDWDGDFDHRRTGRENRNRYGGREYRSRDDGEDRHTPGDRDIRPMDKSTASKWVQEMVSPDGSRGEHWSMAQTSKIMADHNIRCDKAEFYAIMNALWSDYSEVARKYGMDRPEFWAEMTEAWINDDDAKPNKAMRYYQYIVDR